MIVFCTLPRNGSNIMIIDRQSVIGSGSKRRTEQKIKKQRAQETADALEALKSALAAFIRMEEPSLSLHCSHPQLKISCMFSPPSPLMVDGGLRVMLDVSPNVATEEKTRIAKLVNALVQTIMQSEDIFLCLNSEKYEKVS